MSEADGLCPGQVRLVTWAICVDARADEEAGMVGRHVAAKKHFIDRVDRRDSGVEFYADKVAGCDCVSGRYVVGDALRLQLR